MGICLYENLIGHLRLWCYVQRLRQLRSLREIGNILEQGLAGAPDLKRFTGHLCNESYPLGDNLAEEVNELERRWPCFKETDSNTQGTPIHWGDDRYGRIPSFVWDDAGPDYSNMPPSSSQSNEQADNGSSPLLAELHADAKRYEE